MKKLVSLALAAMMLLSLVSFASAEGQTDFIILSGISALSGGYDNNPVLNQMQEEVASQIDNAASKLPVTGTQFINTGALTKYSEVP